MLDGASRWPALALCAFAYLYVFPYQERLNNPNENVRFYMTAAIVEQGHYEIDEMRARWGWVNDAAVHAGHVYSVKAPGTSLLGVPGYAAYRALCQISGRDFDRSEALWACRLTGSILPTLLFLWAFIGFLDAHGKLPALRDAVFFSVAFGSLLYGYGMLFVSHTVSAAAAFAAYMLWYEARGRARVSSLRAWSMGLLTGLVTLFEYPGLVASLVLTAFALPRLQRRGGPRPVASFCAGGLIPALVMMHFQWRAFGSPFTPGHLMVETEAFRAIHHEGFYGAVGPSAQALHGLLLDLGAGLFPLTPVLVFGVFGLALMLRERDRRAEAACAGAVVVLTVLVISSMAHWRGGWTIGPRYLALCVPFLALGALDALSRLAERLPLQTIALAVGCLAAALLASGLPSAYYPHLPPELTRPLPQLVWVLLRHDFAPPNAGAFVGVYGTASMLPLFACGLLSLWLCLRHVPGLRARASTAALAAAVTLALGLPLSRRPDDQSGVREAVAFITRRWSPEGHDAAARLRQRLQAQGRVRDRDLHRLASLYAEEGRVREARRARAGKL